MRWHSAGVLLLFTAKLVIGLGPQMVALNASLRPLLVPLIEPDRPDRSSERTIKGQVAAITVIRNTPALHTIARTLYIACEISAGIEWPVLEFVLFPWP